jgi:hypothetical protein
VLIARADDIGFELKDGRKIDCPIRACMLHDDSGQKWPKCSLLIMNIRRDRMVPTPEQENGTPQWYYGKNYKAHVGSVDLPSRDLSKWKFVGDVHKIFYDRFGTKAPGQFKHHFNKARGLYHVVAIVKGKREVKLYRLGRAYRLELGGGCVVNDLGLVWP